jgi:transcriptional regulator with XRE-family HTH domain
VNSQTIDQVIGGNLQLLRQAESMTTAEMADALTSLTGESFSEVKLWRWETGRYRFKVTDLYLFSQLHGVNLLALLKPDDATITHVKTGRRDTPVDAYVYDFFVDPSGTFGDRATRLAERRAEGTPYVIDAINDISDRLGKKGRIGDWYSSHKRFFAAIEEALEEEGYPEIGVENPENRRAWLDLFERIKSDGPLPFDVEDPRPWRREATTEERNDDGINQQDE